MKKRYTTLLEKIISYFIVYTKRPTVYVYVQWSHVDLEFLEN